MKKVVFVSVLCSAFCMYSAEESSKNNVQNRASNSLPKRLQEKEKADPIRKVNSLDQLRAEMEQQKQNATQEKKKTGSPSGKK